MKSNGGRAFAPSAEVGGSMPDRVRKTEKHLLLPWLSFMI